jgi:hypothetical protein
MTANNRHTCFFVKVDRSHDASLFAFAAADAAIRIHKHTAARTLLKRVARANLHTRGLVAAKAYDCDKAAVHTAGRSNFNRALDKRMVLLINGRANGHARKTAEAFIHFFWLKDLRHISPPETIYSYQSPTKKFCEILCFANFGFQRSSIFLAILQHKRKICNIKN